MVRAFLYSCRGQVQTSDLHAWIGAKGPADNVGGSDDQALTQIYALASPRFGWMPYDVDRIDAQRTVRVLGMPAVEWDQYHRRQAEANRYTHGWPFSGSSPY